MASEDVIELGSSDDEAEPAPKKSKSIPNAMVCIPRKIHEVTIRPSRLNLPTAKGASKAKGLSAVGPIAGGVFKAQEKTVSRGKVPVAKKKTTVRSNIVCNPFASKSITNGKSAQNNVIKPGHLTMIKPSQIQKPTTSLPNVLYVKALETTKTSNFQSALFKNSIKIQNNKSLNNLPPSITVKKTTQACNKPVIFMKPQNEMLKSALSNKQVNDIQIVELDDDEGSPTTSSPAWYLRPEEITDSPALEQENNAELEPPTMIEITIEDSPIKPALNKRACEIGAELAITIDDSPVKPTADKSASPSGSDDEVTITKVPNSKKKLEYPKGTGNENNKTMEIEIDCPIEVSFDTNIRDKEKIDEVQEGSIVTVQTVPEPCKKHDGVEKSTQKTSSTAIKGNNIVTPSSSTQSEFHSVYQSFIDTCFQLDKSEDMRKIVEIKIKAYYKQAPKEYTESEEFVDMVASTIPAMRARPHTVYKHIRYIVNELKMQRRIAKSQIVNMETKTEEPDQLVFGGDSELDTKRQRQIRKLEKTIKKLHRAIQKLEEQEVDFDDEDDSVYLLTERYKERMVRVYAKFCQLTNSKMPSEPRIVLDARPGQPSGPAKRLEKWINKKVPIGTHLPFPDFHDVLRCVRDANDEDKLCWNEADIMEESRDLFTRCGKKLQRRRQENEWRLAASRIACEVDPAENNEDLICKLEANKKLAANKETEIFNKYADRQNQLKLQAVEIGDKEAEQSPVESEDEEANDESVSLENKGKRKERLKRLIQKISKGPSEEKENQPSKETEVEEDAKNPEENQEIITIKETDTKENRIFFGKSLEKSKNNEKDSLNANVTLFVSSDDNNDLESDVDELHLLQKLHSGNKAESSTLESSDSDGPIAISDSIDSGSDTKNDLSDVISIENSSYSESEDVKLDNMFVENTESVNLTVPRCKPNKTEASDIVPMETDCSDLIKTPCIGDGMDMEATNSNSKKIFSESNNNENSESIEDILLASSDEEAGGSQEDGASSADGACINLRDDLISIDETVVGNVADELETMVKSKPSLVIPEKVINADEPSVIVYKADDDHIYDDDKVTENTIKSISIESSQEVAPGACNEESVQKYVSVVAVESDDTKSADSVTNIDVDMAHNESATNSRVEDNLSPLLFSETQDPKIKMTEV